MRKHTKTLLIFIAIQLCLFLIATHLHGQKLSELETGCESPEHPIALSPPIVVRVLFSNCEVDVNAEEFNMGSYDNNSSGADLELEIAVLDADNNLRRRGKSITFDCDDFGESIVVLVVTDDEGNESYSQSIFELQGGDCRDPNCDFFKNALYTPPYSLFGSVFSGNEEPLNCFEIFEDGTYVGMNNQQYSMFVNSNSGVAEATIEISKEDKLDNGLNVLDLILIRRYILQLGDLPYRYSKIAANVNGDNRINTLDMIQIRQAILRQIDEFTAVPAWQFYPVKNLNWDELEGNSTYYNLSTYEHRSELNWYGIKMGDVNGDADLNRNGVKSLLLKSEDEALKKNEFFHLDMSTDEVVLSGYQYTLEFNPELLELIELRGLDEANANFDQLDLGKVALIGFSNSLDSRELVTPVFKVKEACRASEVIELSSNIISAEAYDLDLTKYKLELGFEETETSVPQSVLHPNPFNEFTYIDFTLPENEQLDLKIFNISGVVVYEKNEHFKLGSNVLQIKRSDLGHDGMYFLTIQGNNTRLNHKILLE